MTMKKSHGIGVGVFQIMPDLATGDPAVVAKRAEELGFASYWVPEHAVIPLGSGDVYPGSLNGEPPPDYLYKIPDPFIALSRAAAVTRTIKLGTGVALVPERHPILAAKEIATLDHYSGGRFLYGIGAGWNEAECTVMGGDFPHRWSQVKEYIEVMKKLWSGEYVEHAGTYSQFGPIICQPRPATRPHPPVLLGSIGSPKVYRRVAQWGDGWLPFVVDPKELTVGKAEIAKHARAAGRDPATLDITAFAPGGLFRQSADVKTLAAAGADNVVIWLQSDNEADVLAELDALAAALF